VAKAILDAVWTRLAASAIYTTLGGRIYWGQAPADLQFPLVVYTSPGFTLTPIFGGPVRYEWEVEFSIYCGNNETAAEPITDIWTIAAGIATALSTTTTATGFDRVSFVRIASGVPSFIDDSWSMTERYRVTAFDI
jgi:hypothetical protein